MGEPTIAVVDGVQCLIDSTGLKPLSLSDLAVLPLINVADIERQIMAPPTLRGARGPGMSAGSPRKISKKNLPPAEPPAWAMEGSITPDGEAKVLYSIIPARAVADKRIRGNVLRVFCCLCCYTSPLGIAYPNQATMARRLGIHPTAISKAIRRLREAGYIRLLVPAGKRRPGAFKRGNRYQVLIRGKDPLPSDKETELVQLTV
jgi:DNA-binding transcriptional ArsR family regulator